MAGDSPVPLLLGAPNNLVIVNDTDSDDDASSVDSGEVVSMPVDPGAICAVKDLYRGRAKCACCITWEAEPQKKVDKVTLAATDSGGYAILARKTEGHGDFGRETKLHSVVIQSALIRQVLDGVLKGYPGVTSTLEKLTVEAPFAGFYHRWDALRAAYQEADKKTKEHLGLLIGLLEDEFKNTQTAVADLLKNGVVEHKYIWAIFKPLEHIYAKQNGHDIVLLMENGHAYNETPHGGDRGWMLSCKQIDYNGSLTGYRTQMIKIPEFTGTSPLAELPAFPLEYHPEKEIVRKKLVEQGRLFAEMRMMSYKEYSGRPFPRDDVVNTKQSPINGRVMVDAFAYFQYHCDDDNMLRSFDAPPPANIVYSADDDHHHRHYPPPPPHPMPAPKPIHRGPPRGPPPRNNRRGGGRPPPPPRIVHNDYNQLSSEGPAKRAALSDLAALSDSELLICVPFVRGYSFKAKEWAHLSISDLRPVEWTGDLFSNLVLPAEEKTLLFSLAKAHASPANQFDDFVIGKGKGMIIMLDGPPGVGKTLTAEAVAETMSVPLYTLSAAELGTQPQRVENQLSEILEMASMWNAILLIDEADIFMEERKVADLERNELVSIFLRHLEYFEGLMILTTNRAETMDAAFDSRVDIRLHYPSLDAAARRSVWGNFAKKLPGGSKLTGGDIDALAKLDLNGRQIKSVVKTAQLLANGGKEVADLCGENCGMGIEHVRSVLRITRGIGF